MSEKQEKKGAGFDTQHVKIKNHKIEIVSFFTISTENIWYYINTFVANVQNRMTEFSIMESIGMTPGQLLLMLIKEGILYAGGAWMVTLTVGMGVTYVIYQSMNYRKVPFSILLFAILIAVVVSFLVCIVVPAVTWLILEKNGSLVQRIKEIE